MKSFIIRDDKVQNRIVHTYLMLPFFGVIEKEERNPIQLHELMNLSNFFPTICLHFYVLDT